jgi:hypothetical protein
MSREEKHVVSGIEGVLRPVAVVDIPVGDQDAPEAAGAEEMLGGDGGVVKQAKTLRLPAFGVMAGRPDEGEGVPAFPGEDEVRSFDRSAGGKPRRVIRQGRCRRVFVEDDVSSSREAGRASIRASGASNPSSRTAAIASRRSGHSTCPGLMK